MLVAVTISPVQQGEELLIDYGEHYWENIVVSQVSFSISCELVTLFSSAQGRQDIFLSVLKGTFRGQFRTLQQGSRRGKGRAGEAFYVCSIPERDLLVLSDERKELEGEGTEKEQTGDDVTVWIRKSLRGRA